MKMRHLLTIAALTASAFFASGEAMADIVLVTAADGPIVQISREEAEQLFLGRLSALRDGTPVRLLDLPTGAIRDDFYLKLIGKNSIQTRAYWSRMVFTGRARPPREVADEAELRALMARDANLIGYVAESELTPDLRVLLRLP